MENSLKGCTVMVISLFKLNAFEILYNAHFIFNNPHLFKALENICISNLSCRSVAPGPV